MSATLKESPAMQTKKIMQSNINYSQDREQYQEALDSAPHNFELVSPSGHKQINPQYQIINDHKPLNTLNGSSATGPSKSQPVRKSNKYEVKISIQSGDGGQAVMHGEHRLRAGEKQGQVPQVPPHDQYNVKLSISQKKHSDTGTGDQRYHQRNSGFISEKAQQRCLSSSFAYQEEPIRQQPPSLPLYPGQKNSQTRNYDPANQNQMPSQNPLQQYSKYGDYPTGSGNQVTHGNVNQQEIYTRRHEKAAQRKLKNQLRSSSSGFKPNAAQLTDEGQIPSHPSSKVRTQRDIHDNAEVHNQKHPKSERVNSQKVKKKIKRDFETEGQCIEDMTPISSKHSKQAHWMTSERRLNGSGSQYQREQISSPTMDQRPANMFPMIDTAGEKRRIQNSQIRQISNCQEKKYASRDPGSNLTSQENVGFNRQINSAVPMPENQLQPSAPRTYQSYQQTSVQSPTQGRNQPFDQSLIQNQQFVSEQLNIEDQSRQKRPLVMGLGLGMGIQMGSDGKFYASMGGVTMPSSGQQYSQEDQQMEQAHLQSQTTAKKDAVKKSSIVQGLSNSKEKLLDGHEANGSLEQYHMPAEPVTPQQVQDAKQRFSQKRSSKLMQKQHIDDYQEIFQLCQNPKSLTNSNRGRQAQNDRNGQLSPNQQLQQSFGSPLASASFKESNKSQQKYSSAHASEAAARGNYLEQHYAELNSNVKEQQKFVQQQQKKQLMQQQNIYNDRKISRDHQLHMQMMSGKSNQPVMGLHISHAHPSELIHSQSDPRRNYQKLSNNIKNKAGQMNSTNDTSFTEPIVPEPDELMVQCNHAPSSQYTSPQNNSNLLKLKQNFDDIQKSEKKVAQGNPNEMRPFIMMKNKVEDNIKQLKQGTGNQVIAATSSVGAMSSNERATRVSSLQNTSASKASDNLLFKSQGLQEPESYRSGGENAFNMMYQQITTENIQMSKITDHNEPQFRKKKKLNQVTAQQRISSEMGSAGSPGSKMKRKYMNAESRTNLQANKVEHKINQIMMGSDEKSLQFKMLNGKRSQPPMSEAEIKEQQRQMFKAQIEHIKSNSIAALQSNYQQKEQHIIDITRSMDRISEDKKDKILDFSKLTGSATRLEPTSQYILKQETVLEANNSPDNLVSQQNPLVTPENIEWIKKAMEMNRRVQINASESTSPDATIESDQAMELARQLGDQMMAQAAIRFQSHNQLLTDSSGQAIGIPNKQTTPVPSTKTPTLLAPFMIMNRDDQTTEQTSQQIGQVKKPNMNDSHVKRARLQLERKKKQFENNRGATNSGFQMQQPISDQNLQVEQNYPISNPFVDQFTAGIGARGTQIGQGFICTPNITYKSVLPHSTKVARTSNDNHPLINQQLFNGYIKNPNAIQNSLKNKKSPLGGVQGQNFSMLQKQLSEKQSPTNQRDQLIQEYAMMSEHNPQLEGQIDKADLESLALLNKIAAQAQFEMQKASQGDATNQRNSKMREDSSRQNLLNAVKAAETGQSAERQRHQQIDQVFTNGVPNVGVGKLVVFSQNGQTFVRNHDATKIAQLSKEQVRALGIQIENAQLIADQVASINLAQRSLGTVIMPEDLQQLLALGATLDNQNNDTSPHNQSKSHLNRQRISKGNRASNAQSPSKINQKNSDGSQQSKPTTSTTLNSQNAKNDPKGNKKGASPTKIQKRKVHIWHEDTVTAQYKNHKINKAINTINQIINLVFKNKKDSLALTTMSKNDSLGPPANRLIDENRVNELQKIAKKINIVIPKKFESKTSLREFFFSRDFILNVKIKMNVLLQKSILESNHIPVEVIQANMYSNYEKVKASKEAIQNGSEQKQINQIYQSKKFWVGTGNNFPVVKSVLKQRYWWQVASEESFAEDCDFIWTAWKKQRHIDFLTGYQNKFFSKLDKQKKEKAEAAKKKKKENKQSSDEEEEDGTWSPGKNNPICMPRNSVSKAVEEIPKELKSESDRIVMPIKLYNRMENNKQLTNKKGIFINMRKYYEVLGEDPFKVLPLTFHTTKGIHDPEYRKFVSYYNDLEYKIKRSEEMTKKAIKQYYKERQKTKKETVDYESDYESDEEEEIQAIRRKYRAPKNTWIIKPGENTNRGQGIQVVKNMREVQNIVTRTTKQDRTFIIQKYIDYPLLVHKRKFDFRVYGMMTSINGSLKGYCYQDGYVRTSSREYNLDDVSDTLVHLTNDAIQNKSEDYGKFENANKMSFQDFTKVINAQQPDLDFDLQRDIFPQIQKLIADTYRATFHKLDPTRLQNTFELFGYDFMIDEDFRLYLIEVNTNPCLEVCCPLLARIIPEVLDNCFKIVLDPLFPSPDLSHNRKFQLNELPQEVKFQLVFDEEIDGPEIRQMFKTSCKGSIREEGNEDIESDKEDELVGDDGDDSEEIE